MSKDDQQKRGGFVPVGDRVLAWCPLTSLQKGTVLQLPGSHGAGRWAERIEGGYG